MGSIFCHNCRHRDLGLVLLHRALRGLYDWLIGWSRCLTPSRRRNWFLLRGRSFLRPWIVKLKRTYNVMGAGEWAHHVLVAEMIGNDLGCVPLVYRFKNLCKLDRLSGTWLFTCVVKRRLAGAGSFQKLVGWIGHHVVAWVEICLQRMVFRQDLLADGLHESTYVVKNRVFVVATSRGTWWLFPLLFYALRTLVL